MATRRWSWASTKSACAGPASPATICCELKAAYRVIYRSGLMWQEMLDTLRLEFPAGPASEFLPFFAERQARLRARTPHAAGRDRSPASRRRRRHELRTAAGRKEGRLDRTIARPSRPGVVHTTNKRARPIWPGSFYCAYACARPRTVGLCIYSPLRPLSVPDCLSAAWAAASRAIGTRNGLHDT